MKKLFFYLVIWGMIMTSPVLAQTGSSLENLKLQNVVDSFKNIGKEEQRSPAKSATVTQKFRIKKIEIRGNKHIPSAVIRNQIWLKIGEEANELKIQINARNIRNLGVFDDVSATTVSNEDGKTVIYTVKENPVIGEIIFEGTTSPSENLVKQLKSKSGDLLNRIAIRQDIEVIKRFYEDAGYINFKINDITYPKKDNDPLIFNVSEAVIEGISVTGNEKTQSYVILRELNISTGDVLTKESIQENMRRVYNLNFFEDVYPDFIPTANGYEVELNVRERPTNGQFTFGGGFSPQSGFSVFSDLFWDNLFGSGQLLMVKGNFGLGGGDAGNARNSTFQIKYVNPWMWDTRKSFTAKLWQTNGLFRTTNPILTGQGDNFQQENRTGIELGVGFPIDDYRMRVSHSIKYENVSLGDVNETYNLNSYIFGLTYDNRDVRFNPRAGEFFSTSIENAFRWTHDTIDFTRFEITALKFIPTFEKQTIALKLNLGYLTGSDIGNQDLFSGEYFRVGFPDTVRSQDDDDFIFGNKKIVTSAEYRFLFTDTFSLAFFIDAGIASNGTFAEWDVEQLILIGKGLGIRFLVPGIGPLRIDAGTDQEGVMRVQVNFGHAF